MTGFEKVEKASEDEEDVLEDLGRLFRPNETRMACQIKLNKEMEGCIIEIPRSAFAFFEKITDQDD